MNVVNLENSLAPPGAQGRGRGRGRGRDLATGSLAANNPNIKSFPKYEIKTDRRPLVNLVPTTNNDTRTPVNPRNRGHATSSSAFVTSSSRRPCLQSGASAQVSSRSATISNSDHCVIVAITSGRGEARCEIGIAAIDVQYPHMILCQISDCNTYINTLTKIHALNPVEIIMPDTMCERSISPNGIYRAIKERFDSITITSIARMHFHDSAGMDRIKTHCAEEYASVELYVKTKYYALAAASALLKYVEYVQCMVYAPKSMRIDFQGSQNTAMIDIESAQSLELVTSEGGRTQFSLLASMDRCSTPMGRNLLRASILQPPCNVDLIQGRQACVAELISNRALHSIIQPVVKRLFGASRLLSLSMLTNQSDSVQSAEKNLNYILLLKNIIDIVPEFKSVLTTGRAPFFQKVTQDLSDQRYQSIKEKILSVIHSDARSVMGFTSSNMQRCFAIRSGINDMLDVARQTYCELIDDMQMIVAKLSEQYNLPLSLGCNATLGYHIQMESPRRTNFKLSDIPDAFIEVHKKRSTIFMTTPYLHVLSKHCKDACEELHVMSNVLLSSTLTDVRDQIGCLLRLNDNVAELDLILSISQVSSIPDYVRPTFGAKLSLINSRHPVMDIRGIEKPVPNNITASTSYNFHNITGPNMSGKSVYLRQIVLLQIMAQIGSYVPATSAEIRITDRIFCRICIRDDIECNSSKFVLEIKESQYILQSITPTSLVIMDELCRGTTVEEGTSIAWAICEHLVLSSSAFVFNATHFLYLARLAELYWNVTNYYFETESRISQTGLGGQDTRLIYTHRLREGFASVWNYGIALARSTGLPESIVKTAQEFAVEIAKTVKFANHGDGEKSREKISYDCVAEINRLLQDGKFNAENLVKVLKDVKISVGFGKFKDDGVVAEIKVTNSEEKIEQMGLKRSSGTSGEKVEVKKAKIVRSQGRSRSERFSYLREAMKIRSEKSSVKSSDVPVSSLERERRTSYNKTDSRMEIEEIQEQDSESVGSSAVATPIFTTQGMEVYSGATFSGGNSSGKSLPTPVERKSIYEKEDKIFKVIEDMRSDEASLDSSFHSIDLESGNED